MDREDYSEFINRLRKVSESYVEVPDLELELQDNDDADNIDHDLRKSSEDTYQKIASNIVNVSSVQLHEQNRSKNMLKQTFTVFFICFLSLQYLLLISFLYIKSYYEHCGLSDAVLISYMTSVFVETLGAIIVMIKYAFDSKQEVNILRILNGVISNFQKFN